MNVNMVTISNMLMETTSPTVASSKPDTNKKTSQFSLIGNDNQQQVNTYETETPDNVQMQSQQESVTGQAQDIVDTPQEKIISKTPQTAKAGEKSKEQVLSNGAFSKTNTAQPVLTEGKQMEVILPIEGSAANAVSDQEGSNIHTQTNVTNQADKVIPAVIQSQNTAQTTINVPIPTVPETESESVNLMTSENHTEQKSVVPEILERQPTNNKAQKAIANINTEQIQKESITGSNKSIIPENGEKLEVEKVTTGSKTLIADVNVKENVPESSTEEQSREISISNSRRLISKYTVDSDTKSTNVDQNKAAAVPMNSSPVQVKSSESQVEPVMINPEKSASAAEKTNIDKADNPQTLTESLQNKSKEVVFGGRDTSSESNVQKLKVADLQISSDQIKGRDNTNATSGNNSGSDFGQTLQHNNVQIPFTEQSQGVIENTKTNETPTQTLQHHISTDVGKQIFESIQSSASRQSGDQQVTVRLNPPELGKVYIKFQEQDHQITGLMEVSKTQTRVEIEQVLPQIVRNLADSGIQIRRFEVVLNNNEGSGQEAVKDQLLHNGETGHHDTTNSGSYESEPNAMGINEWLSGNNGYQSISELQEMLVTEGSINVLL